MNFFRKIKESIVSTNALDRFLFNGIKRIIGLLIISGVLCAAGIIIFDGKQGMYNAMALLLIVIWIYVFLRYFVWALYFYNVNYGIEDKVWDDIKNPEKPSVNAPKHNPYRDHTFGLPPGTVRGMIAFTLLFGALAMLIYAMGKDFIIPADSYFWDQLEFYKTAFLMMIAFYFGSRSLQYLQNRWGIKSTVPQQNSGLSNTGDEHQSALDTNGDDNGECEGSIGLDKFKDALSDCINNYDNEKTPVNGFRPIIDAGHGGVIDGVYVTAPSKMYTFLDANGKKVYAIYEGDINRKIGLKLIGMLNDENIPYHDLTVSTNLDMSLSDRVKRANELYGSNSKYYYLSIHSNCSSATAEGTGSKANGFEVWTSRNQTKSDKLADIVAKHYKDKLGDFKFRQDMSDGDPDKESNFYVLKKTDCPAFLVENLFFDNKEEADYLLSDEGQNEIAECLFDIVKEIYCLESI